MISGFYWHQRPSCVTGTTEEAEDFPEAIPALVRHLLLQRGHRGGLETQRFLFPRLADLTDPYAIGGIQQAVDRIFQAVDSGEDVCIYGDYDVDGVTSVAVLRAVLGAYGLHPHYFIPIRSQEGYGLSKQGLERCLHELDCTPSLIITVDCGTSSVVEVDYLHELGIDVIILDHHEGGDGPLPAASAVVNPKVEAYSPYTYLCSAGVVFKLAHALLKARHLDDFDLKEYVDMVAVATVADIVPLVGENRLLVRRGLQQLMHSAHMGLRALTELAGLSGMPTAAQVGFRIGPRLNAAGRMDSPLDALDLLLENDIDKARFLSHVLDDHNKRRQEEEEAIRTEAIAMLQHFDLEKNHVIVLGARSWHPGVVGIVASQLMRRYYKPTFVIAIDSAGVGKGSGRTIPGVSLVQAISACSDCLISGGGHDMAAGLVIEEKMIVVFRQRFNEYVVQTTTPQQWKPVLLIDAEVSFVELTLELLDSYELLEPFGNSNPLPVFMSRGVFPTEPPKRVGNNHLKLFMRQGFIERDAIFFNGANFDFPDPPWDIAFTIDRNIYRGRASLSISIQDIRSAIPIDQDGFMLGGI